MSSERPASRRFAVAAPEMLGDGPLPADAGEVLDALGVPITALELWCPWQVSLANVQQVRRGLRAAGITVACVSSPSFLHGNSDGSGRRLISESIAVAGLLGADRVNTYFGHGGDGDDDRAINNYAREVEPLLHEAEQTGVTIVLENEFDAFGRDPEHRDVSRRPGALLRLMQVIDHPRLKLNFDAANFFCAQVDPAQAIEELAPHVAYVHVKDVAALGATSDLTHQKATAVRESGWRIYQDGDLAYQTTELVEGDVDWAAIVQRLDRCAYDGYYTFEPHCDATALPAQLASAIRCLSGGA